MYLTVQSWRLFIVFMLHKLGNQLHNSLIEIKHGLIATGL